MPMLSVFLLRRRTSPSSDHTHRGPQLRTARGGLHPHMPPRQYSRYVVLVLQRGRAGEGGELSHVSIPYYLPSLRTGLQLLRNSIICIKL